MDVLDVELYKSLKSENASYNDKLQSLWLQKFTLSGALAAFIIIKSQDIAALNQFSPVVVGLLLLIALALTIDLKVLEYGLHVNAISQFIKRSFPDAPRVAMWEDILWRGKGAPERPLIVGRSFLTVLSAALPTMALIGAATWILAEYEGVEQAWTIGAGITGAYVTILLVSVWAVFSRSADML